MNNLFFKKSKKFISLNDIFNICNQPYKKNFNIVSEYEQKGIIKKILKDENIKIKFTKNRISIEKEILITKKIIDLNFLYSILISQGNRLPLKIDFEEQFNYKIEAIKAADEVHFESYLCPYVLKKNVLDFHH